MTNLNFYVFLLSIVHVYGQNQAPVAETDTWDFSAEWSEKGFINVYDDQRALFYWAWESEFRLSDDQSPPLMIWLSGPDGYGVSSIRDLFFSNGPYKIIEFPGPYGTDTLKMTLNPYKLNTLANMVWIDQPAGAGYSYSNTSVPVSTFEEAALDLCEFLKKFLSKYPNFDGLDLYIGGDGNAATILLSLSDMLLEADGDVCPITNYRGMMLTGPIVGIGYQWKGAVKTAKHYEVFNEDITNGLEERLEECLELYSGCAQISPKAGGDATSDLWAGCMVNFLHCKKDLTQPSDYKASGTVFDKFNIVNSDCNILENLYTNWKCNQDFLTGLDRWLQEGEVLTAYGIPEFTNGFDMYNTSVAHDFLFSGARHFSYKPCLEKALASGIRVLIWTGQYDYFGSAYGLEMLMEDVQGYEDITEREVETWTSTYGPEVFYQRKEDLTFATVKHAGHHLSFDFPRATQGFFTKWLYNMDSDDHATFLPNVGVFTEVASGTNNLTTSILYGALAGGIGTIIFVFLAWCVKSKLLGKAYSESQYEKSYCTTESQGPRDVENKRTSSP